MKEWGPGDVIAVIIVIAATLLLAAGRDGVIATALLAVTAFYYGAEKGKTTVQKLLAQQ